jgi:lipopolysaccharide/colanic/teichoic acid biosynthesis glycosyltransferase
MELPDLDSDVVVAVRPPHSGYDIAKRFLDIVIALVGLVVGSPVLALCAVLIRLNGSGPIIHKRVVVGRGGRVFRAYKLRTMIADADRYLEEHRELLAAFDEAYKLKKDPRVTQVGRWLRKLSLDELPQLLNVLRGEMSLVGPRMIVPAELEKYGVHREKLLTVKPGLTGLWQVAGRQRVSYVERVRLDMEYIDRRSPWVDLKIMLQTIPALLSGRGAY